MSIWVVLLILLIFVAVIVAGIILTLGLNHVIYGSAETIKSPVSTSIFEAAALSQRNWESILKNEEVGSLMESAPTMYAYKDLIHRLPYFGNKGLIHNKHNGQLKLFLSELQFLTHYSQGKTLVIYAGAAPSNKIPMLSALFPDVHFVLVDPNEVYALWGAQDQYDEEHIDKFLYFSVAQSAKNSPGHKLRVDRGRTNPIINMFGVGHIKRSDAKPISLTHIGSEISKLTHKFYIIEDFYTITISKFLRNIKTRGTISTVLFMSDIRTTDNYESPSDLDVLFNSAQQYNWVKELGPDAYMLKFRCPYGFGSKEKTNAVYLRSPHMHDDFELCSIPLLENYYQKKFMYLKGDAIWLQAFSRPSSTETRLVGTTLEECEYDIREYEERHFFYNKIHRPLGWHSSHEAYLNTTLGIDRCGDCALMCQIVFEYVSKFKTGNVLGIIKDVLHSTSRNIRDKSGHGLYYWKYKRVPNLPIHLASLSLSRHLYTSSKSPVWTPITEQDAATHYGEDLRWVMSHLSTSIKGLGGINSEPYTITEIPNLYELSIGGATYQLLKAGTFVESCLANSISKCAGIDVQSTALLTLTKLEHSSNLTKTYSLIEGDWLNHINGPLTVCLGNLPMDVYWYFLDFYFRRGVAVRALAPVDQNACMDCIKEIDGFQYYVMEVKLA